MKGAPPIALSAATVNGSVEVLVRDHGGRIGADFEPRIFERFARSSNPAGRAKHGTGLGLSIVRGLTRAGGGDAWYERGAAGACFCIRFPKPVEEPS